MTGKQIFWSCALGGYIIFAAIVFNGDEIEGFCLLLISAVIAAIVGGIYALVKFVMWYGKEKEPTTRAAERSPVRTVRKELGKIKKNSDANTAALLQYIHDAIRDGWEEEAIGNGLLAKGWSEDQVRGAFGAYKDMLARHPLPKKGLAA